MIYLKLIRRGLNWYGIANSSFLNSSWKRKHLFYNVLVQGLDFLNSEDKFTMYRLLNQFVCAPVQAELINLNCLPPVQTYINNSIPLTVNRWFKF